MSGIVVTPVVPPPIELLPAPGPQGPQGSNVIIPADPNNDGVVDPGIDGAPSQAPATESVFRWFDQQSVSDWLAWVVWPTHSGQLSRGVIAFGPNSVVAQSGALRFATPIGSRTVLMASRDQVSGAFQSIINVSSGDAGIVPSLEIGREFWDQTLLYGKTVIFVCNGGPGGDDNVNGWLFEQEGFSYQATMIANQTTKSIFWRWSMANCSQAAVTTSIKGGKGTELLFQAGESSNDDGGDYIARGGFNAAGGSTKRGGFKAQFHGGFGAMQTIIEAIEATPGNRVVTLCRGRDSTAVDLPAGAGDLVAHLAPAATIPTVPPASGFYIFCDPADNKLKVMGKNGTVTPLANP